MVRTLFKRAAPFIAMLCLAGCEIFIATPFPGFTSRTDISLDLGSRIDAIAAGKSPLTYDLEVVDDPTQQPRVLLLVEPPSSDATLGFNYTGQLIFMDKDLNVVGQAPSASTLDYFSKPFGYAHDGNILAGYTVLTPDGVRAANPPASGGTPNGVLNPPPGIEGFAFVEHTGAGSPITYIFSTPAGQYASFDISFVGYNTPIWGNLTSGTLQIIPPAARPSTSDPNYANLGYQLVGIGFDQANDQITFVLSEPAQGRIVVARMDVTTATSGGVTPLLGATSWPVDGSAWPIAVTVDRPELHADTGGFFMIQRDGWMTRYDWTVTAAAPALVSGSPEQIVGDRSLSRHYAFLNSQTGGQYMYRFDPSSRILTRYKRWW